MKPLDPSAPSENSPTKSLADTVLSGGYWMGAAAVLQAILQIVIFAVLARLLAPVEFGKVAIAGIFVDLAAGLAALGTGQSLVQQRELTEHHIRFAGFITNPFSMMARCSVFVLSSRFEGLPNVLIEALASGAKVVSTDCPSGPRDIIGDDLYGRLVPVGDALAMSDAILATIGEEHNSARSRARGLDFTIKKSVDLYEQAVFGTTV